MTRATVLSLVCIGVLCAILILGFWPFRRPRNEVSWLGSENGLHLVGHSTIFSSSAFQMDGSAAKVSCSLEIWLQPAHTRASSTFLSFYTPENPLQLSLRQYFSHLILESTISGSKPQNSLIGIDGVFDQAKPVFITITSGVEKTAMYVNGSLARAFPSFRLGKDFAGQMIISNTPLEPDGWGGKLRGLAIYYRELTPAEATRHYETWTTQGTPEVLDRKGLTALFLFDERAGKVVHNAVPAGIDLYIPERFSLWHQVLLKPFWKEYEPTWVYFRDLLVNVFGFVPLGFFFYAYWSLMKPHKSAAFFTVIFGLAVSLTIEIGQSYLPTRSSGMTDLITNTFGTFLGVKLCGLRPIRDSFVKALEGFS